MPTAQRRHERSLHLRCCHRSLRNGQHCKQCSVKSRRLGVFQRQLLLARNVTGTVWRIGFYRPLLDDGSDNQFQFSDDFFNKIWRSDGCEYICAALYDRRAFVHLFKRRHHIQNRHAVYAATQRLVSRRSCPQERRSDDLR